MQSLAATPRKQDFANNCRGHPRSIANQEELLEGTSAGVERVEQVLSPNNCVMDVLTQGRFVMGSAYVVKGLEAVETAHGDRLNQHAADSTPYPVPTRDGPNLLLGRPADHYHLAPGGMHEESGGHLRGRWKQEPCSGDNDRSVNVAYWYERGAREAWIPGERDECNTSHGEARHAFLPYRVGEDPK